MNDTDIEKFKSFETWRQDMNEFNAVYCEDFINRVYMRHRVFHAPPRANFQMFERFPNLIARLTRQKCECKEDCTQKSLRNFNAIACPRILIPSNYKVDDKYYGGSFLDMKVVDGDLVGSDFSTNGTKIRLSIKEYIHDLCEDKKGSLRKLKCKAYEMMDHCGDNSDCLDQVTLNTLPPNFRTCKKVEFSDDLSNIGLKMGNRMLLKHVRVSRDIKPFNEIESMSSKASNFISIDILKYSIILSVFCTVPSLVRSKNLKALFLLIWISFAANFSVLMTL